MGGPQSLSGRGGEDKKYPSLPPPGIESQFSSPFDSFYRPLKEHELTLIRMFETLCQILIKLNIGLFLLRKYYHV
jgi:hypothetical protein